MDTHQLPHARGNHHPLMILAALAVLLFCLVGTAAVMGWLPSSVGSNAARGQLSEADRTALAAGMQQQGAATLPAPMPAPATPAAPPALAQQYAPAPQPAYPADAYQAQPAQAMPAQPVPVQPQVAMAAPRAMLDEPAPRHTSRPVQLAAEDHARGWCANCGNIESIRSIAHRARGSGLGAGAGAVLGGLLGHQIGGGNGRQLATVAGAVGGAVVGNQVEGNMHPVYTYEIRVRLDDGTLRTFHQSAPPSWRTGERVRIVKGHLRRA
jgi:outer membrane lipoprotein SlyB